MQALKELLGLTNRIVAWKTACTRRCWSGWQFEFKHYEKELERHLQSGRREWSLVLVWI